MTLADLRQLLCRNPETRRPSLPHPTGPVYRPSTLAEVPPGRQVQVAGFLAGLSSERQAHLRSYGLAPGAWIQVKQHLPVTIVQIDYTELALEDTLARLVSVS